MKNENNWKKYAQFVEWMYTYHESLEDKSEQRDELCAYVRKLLDLPVEGLVFSFRDMDTHNEGSDAPF